jgi:3-dehydroquinate dehydratase
MKIRSPKTEHSRKDFRVIPLFKLLRIELVKLHQQAQQPKTGTIIKTIVLNKTDVAIKRAVERSGEPVWERLLQNLRASRANEIYRKSGEMKESLWIGHITKVARNHYLHLIEFRLCRSVAMGGGLT